MLRPGYAIEYDAIDPTETRAHVETKENLRLFRLAKLTNQRYEEAACQGLMAGLTRA